MLSQIEIGECLEKVSRAENPVVLTKEERWALDYVYRFWTQGPKVARQKAAEAEQRAGVDAVVNVQQTNNAIALLMEIVECAKNDKSVDTWLLSNYKRVNAVVAQQH